MLMSTVRCRSLAHGRDLQRPLTRHAAPAADDPFMQIARLGELRDNGLLSDEEFEAKKPEIIGRI